MILVKFFTMPSGGLTGFRMSGHAGAGEAGTDIVCAAVSSAAYLTANGITEILHVNAQIDVADGEMYLSILPRDVPACHDFLAAFKLHMLGLEEQYPKNIKVSYTEV